MRPTAVFSGTIMARATGQWERTATPSACTEASIVIPTVNVATRWSVINAREHVAGAVKCLVGTVTLTGNAAGISSATSVTLSADGLACDQGAIVPRVVSAAGGRLVEGKGDVLLVCQKENIVMLVTIAVAA
eukprot:GHVS01102918.1.p2 GENE.GHVS01102918.1~~GHVS01102918.1.p2  ORF type:complete len:132 (+),score=15.89 GHVS01102918.1:267-662(+)